MRELKMKDVHKMSKILKKLGLKVGDVAGKKQEQVGAELVLQLFENIHLAETEVNEFLADMAGMTVMEFEELPIDKGYDLIQDFKSLAMVSDFLERANQLTK